jgi:hypothetical protein
MGDSDDLRRLAHNPTDRRLARELDAVKETPGIGVLGHVDQDTVALGRAELFEELGIAVSAQPLSYLIEADVHIGDACEGVLIAHGDATTGYSLYVQSGYLVHDMNIGGEHVIVRSQRPVPQGEHRLGVRVRRLTREAQLTMGTGLGPREFTLLIDGIPAGRIESRLGFFNFISWTGLDIAIVLQAKSKKLTLPARKGNDLQLQADFKAAVQDGVDQARRAYC